MRVKVNKTWLKGLMSRGAFSGLSEFRLKSLYMRLVLMSNALKQMEKVNPTPNRRMAQIASEGIAMKNNGIR